MVVRRTHHHNLQSPRARRISFHSRWYGSLMKVKRKYSLNIKYHTMANAGEPSSMCSVNVGGRGLTSSSKRVGSFLCVTVQLEIIQPTKARVIKNLVQAFDVVECPRPHSFHISKASVQPLRLWFAFGCCLRTLSLSTRASSRSNKLSS